MRLKIFIFIIQSNITNLYWYILQLFFQNRASIFALYSTCLHSKLEWRTFSAHPSSIVGIKNFHIGLFCECNSSQKITLSCCCPRPAASSLDYDSPWDEISMERIVGTDILCAGVACKNSGKVNGAIFVRSLIVSADL